MTGLWLDRTLVPRPSNLEPRPPGLGIDLPVAAPFVSRTKTITLKPEMPTAPQQRIGVHAPQAA